MIYLFTEYDKITDEVLDGLISRLPDKRKKKALRFRHTGGKISCVVGYMVFLYGFRNLYGLSETPDFSIEKNGKPYLAEYPDIHFNISHCNGAVACIFGDMPVGIDIQDMRELTMRHAERVCSAEEIDRIVNSAEPDLEFCRIWSIKESLSKLTGDGVFRDIRNLAPRGTHLSTVFIEPNKYMTASSYNRNDDFAVHKLTLKNLIDL